MKIWNLWQIPVEDGIPKKIGLERSWGIYALMVSPDGRQLAFTG
jgi:hypothetical protein